MPRVKGLGTLFLKNKTKKQNRFPGKSEVRLKKGPSCKKKKKSIASIDYCILFFGQNLS